MYADDSAWFRGKMYFTSRLIVVQYASYIMKLMYFLEKQEGMIMNVVKFLRYEKAWHVLIAPSFIQQSLFVLFFDHSNSLNMTKFFVIHTSIII